MNTIKYEKLQEREKRRQEVCLHGWLENAKKEKNTHSSSNAFMDGFFLA